MRLLTDNLGDKHSLGETPACSDEEEYVERLFWRRPEEQHHQQRKM